MNHNLEVNWIKNVDTRIENLPDSELNDKIELLESYGYFYNPYKKCFYNLFNEKSLKAIVVYNLSSEGISKLVKDLNPNLRFKNLNDVKSEVFDEGPFWRIGHIINSGSGIFATILLISSFIFYLNSSLFISVIFASISLILSKWYFTNNSLYDLYFYGVFQSRLWQKFQIIFLIQNLILYLFLFFLLYTLTGKIIIPIVAILIVHYIMKRKCINYKAKEYWADIFHGKITDFANENIDKYNTCD